MFDCGLFFMTCTFVFIIVVLALLFIFIGPIVFLSIPFLCGFGLYKLIKGD